MITRDFLRGRRRQQMSAQEQAALEQAMGTIVDLPRRHLLIRTGDPVRRSTLLLEGFMCRYMDARDGQRQLVSIHVPGDFVDLHGYPLQRLDHDVATLTEAKVATIDHQAITELVEAYPHLGRLMWFSTMLDAAMHREWIFRLGRLDAAGRVAHLISETHARLEAIDRTEDGAFDFPLTQQDIGEATGLTNVHVNRTLKALRDEGLLRVSSGRVEILDQRGLATRAEFSPDYLYLAGDDLATP